MLPSFSDFDHFVDINEMVADPLACVTDFDHIVDVNEMIVEPLAAVETDQARRRSLHAGRVWLREEEVSGG
ncbi:MAG: hypothetical protein IAF94_25430 [Pirellulaceae bacterium]|nr:hypothetical protein [Pirellulaceae bacterium]